jgi:predicted extracellular nuclease/2',3'-cyclic-nucleotide 2'-phosphodiesterase (5'-nucleotidase family)
MAHDGMAGDGMGEAAIYWKRSTTAEFESQAVSAPVEAELTAAEESPVAALAVTAIYDIQGAGHKSAFDGTVVTTSGIVTARASNGFYVQDAAGDGNIATSDAIFVFTGKAPDAAVVVGAEVQLTGRVTEFLPGGVATNLTITEIDQVTEVSVLSTGNAVPAATVIGQGGRTPPNQVIDDDSFASFDPATDGIDFYESLEGMLVQVNNAQVVGATNRFGEIFVVADGGKDAGPETDAGGLYVSPGDFNPERIQIDDTLFSKEPAVNVGDNFTGSITGVVSYDFGNYEVLNTGALPATKAGGEPRETTSLVGTEDQLTVATFNVENLNPQVGDPGGTPDRLDALAQIIINNMAAPDILVLEEMQDNNGATNDGTVAGDQTFQELIDAIAAAGGPHYEFIQIDPANNQDGGAPGANIRVGFLYNPERVTFVPEGNADADDANSVTADGFDADLTLNAGRVDPTNPAFNQDPVTGSEGARKPLAAEFIFNGQKVFIIANHLKSKTGDTPLFGSTQPAVETTAAQRAEQAQILNDFVAAILAADPSANVIVAGDLNDFEFSKALQVLKGDELTNLVEQIPQSDRYTFNFEGNSQELDHILVSDNMVAGTSPEVDIVHVNVDYAESTRASDHDPIVTRFTIAAPTSVSGGNKSDVIAGESGSDTLSGGNGNDKLTAGSGNDVVTGGNGNDLLDGGFGNDSLTGGNNNDTLSGGIDDDTLSGGNNNDKLDGGDHDDQLSGGNNNDTLLGGSGNDELEGGNNNDLLDGGAGDDTMDGGIGSDRFVVAPGGGIDEITDFDEDRDTIDLTGHGFADFKALLAATSQDGDDTVIVLGAGDKVILSDYDRDDLEADAFIGFTGGKAATTQAATVQAATAEAVLAESAAAEPPIQALADGVFTLQILHASDLEADADAVENAPNFAAIIDLLEDQYANTLTLSSGDNYIPGVFLAAGTDPSVRDELQEVYGSLYGLPGQFDGLLEAPGHIDISIMNIIGFDAATLGNHEFDLGTTVVRDNLRFTAGAANTVESISWIGTQFPYLSSNLDFSGDPNLAGLFTNQILPNTAFQTTAAELATADGINAEKSSKKIAQATTIEVNGETIGVVGATTQKLETISSPGGVDVIDPEGVDDMVALAAQIQPVIDALIAQGIDKIIVMTHLQDLNNERALLPLLHGVDVLIGGGSNTLLADSQDVLRSGDAAADTYPLVMKNADGKDAVIVNTDGEYEYVGRLVFDFDANGDLIASSIDPNVSGAIATTDEMVTKLWGAEDPFAEGTKGDLVRDLTEAVGGVINVQDGNTFGNTDVFLEGRRVEVRTEETNLGNLTADANLAWAQQKDPTVLVSIKNGGGIRDAIGTVADIAPGVPAELPPQANPSAGKVEGEVSQLDIANSLRFNNALSLVTVTAEQLLLIAEHAVAATAAGATPGQFAQIGGMAYSFDPSRAAGDRILSLAITGNDGEVIDVIARDGDLVGDASRAIRLVTLTFMVTGGDSYPFPAFIAADPEFANRVDLVETGVRTGAATFADNGTEQDALAEYLASQYGTTPFNEADTTPVQDERIQNVAFRPDDVLAAVENQKLNGGFGSDELTGAAGDDRIDGRFGDDSLAGEAGSDKLLGGFGDDGLDGGSSDDSLDGGFGDDTMLGGSGADKLAGGFGEDEIDGGDGADSAAGGFGDDEIDGGTDGDTLDGGFGNDTLGGGDGADRMLGGFGADHITGGAGADMLSGGAGRDRFILAEIGEGVDTITDFNFGRFGDTLDIGDVLESFDPSAVDGFLRTVESGGNTTLEVDVNGGGDSFQALVVFQGATGLNVASLVDSGVIETA